MTTSLFENTKLPEKQFDGLSTGTKLQLTEPNNDQYLKIFDIPFTQPKKIVFCNNKRGVGKTMLIFNIAAEANRQGLRVVMVDLDPQTNLTMNVLGENRSSKLFFNSWKFKFIQL